MPYKEYDELISSYEVVLRRYAESVMKLRGMSGGDFERGLAAAEALRRSLCSIEGQLRHHWQSEHSKPQPEPKFSRNIGRWLN